MDLTEQTAREPVRPGRGPSLLDATMIVIGPMIGSGIFVTSAKSALPVGRPGWLLKVDDLRCRWPGERRPGSRLGQFGFLRASQGIATDRI